MGIGGGVLAFLGLFVNSALVASEPRFGLYEAWDHPALRLDFLKDVIISRTPHFIPILDLMWAL
jgi:hypothetical protein